MPLPSLPTVELVQHNPEDLSVDKFEVIELPAPEVMDDSETKELTDGDELGLGRKEDDEDGGEEKSDTSDDEDEDAVDNNDDDNDGDNDDDEDDDDDEGSDAEEGFVDARTDSDSNLLIISLASHTSPEDETSALSEDTDS